MALHRNKKISIQEQFKEEEARSAAFLQKLNNIKKSNKESKQRTVLNQHKLDWHNQIKQYIKREKELEDDLLKFMNEYQNLSVQSKCEEATRNVRMHLKRKRESSLKLQKEFSDIDSQGFGFESQISSDNQSAIEESTNASSKNKNLIQIKNIDDQEIVDDSYYMTIDPMNDEIFSFKDLLQAHNDDLRQRTELEYDLFESVRGVKQLTESLKIQQRVPKNKHDPKQLEKDELAIHNTKMKTNELINEFQQSLAQMSEQFKYEAAECIQAINYHKQNISNISGFDESVIKGFDFDLEISVDEYDEAIDKLDVYANFLGQNEYFKMKENLLKALNIMTELFKVEKERIHMNAPIQYTDLIQKYDQEILNRFQNIHEIYQKNGKTREKYVQRLQIEFINTKQLQKADTELIDSYFEHKRWVKQKEKALLRDLQRDRQALKEKAILMIEQEVEEQRIKLQKDIELSKIDSKKGDLHEKLSEQKKEYMQRMKIIEEIKKQKESQQIQEQQMKENLAKKRADEQKLKALNFKDQKQIDKLKAEQIKIIQEDQQKKQLLDLINQNKEKVNQRQAMEFLKIQEKTIMLEEKKQEPIMRQEKLDKVVEGYTFRPKIEIDRERVQQETDSREIRKALEFDQADKIHLFKNPGFTSDKLMQDIRFKISSALHSAGLQNSIYGQQVLKGVSDGYVHKVQSNQGTKGLF